MENQPENSGSVPPSLQDTLKPPPQPINLSRTGVPPFVIIGFVLVGFIAAAVIFAYFSRAKSNKAVSRKQETAAVSPTIVEVVSPPVPTSPVSMVGKEEKPLPTLALSGIIFGSEGSLALINGRIIKEGAVVEGAKLEKISADRVELSFEDHKIILRSK